MERAISRQDFERLVHDHHEAVYRAARRVVGPEDARDAAQQVFLAILEGRLRPEEARDPGRLLRWKAAREALSLARASASRKRREEGRAMAEQVEAGGPEEREARGRIRQELDALPAGLREAVVLRFVEGLTLSEVGAALRVSTTTAHERVAKGLEWLRRALTRAGFGALAVGLESRLADAAPVAVPPGLARELLALEAGSLAGAGAAALSAKLVAGLSVLVVAGSMVAGAVGLQRSAEPREELAMLAPDAREIASVPAESPASVTPGAREVVAAQDPDPLPPPSPPPPPERTGFLAGLVVDTDGLPLEGVHLRAFTVERKDKRARSTVEGSTGRDGRFRIGVPVLAPEGDAYRVTALTLGYVEWTSPEVRVRADEEARVPEARLPAGGGEEPGPWTLAVHVATEAGEPVEGALVRVFRRRERGDGGQELRRQETSGRTDAGGRIELEGAILGSKQIVVDGRDAGFALWERPLDLKTAGARADLAATLQPGLEIRGTVRTPDGSPPGELQVYAFDDPAQWRHGTLGSDGRFVIRGLDSGTYHLHVRGHRTPWSPVHRAVLAGTDVELVLKRADDPRDVGDHAAELHGHLVDRATGAPLALDLEAVGLRWAKPGSAWADVAPLALAPSMAQQSREMGWEPPPPSSAFHLTGLDAGTYLVVARAPGKAPAVSGPFELAAGALLSGIVLELGPGAELRGRVLDVDGGELHGVHVVLLGRGPESARQLAEWDRELRSNRGRGVQLLPSLGCWCSQCAGEGGRVKLRRIPAGMAVRVGALHPDREPVLADLPAATDGAVLEADLRFRAKR